MHIIKEEVEVEAVIVFVSIVDVTMGAHDTIATIRTIIGAAGAQTVQRINHTEKFTQIEMLGLMWIDGWSHMTLLCLLLRRR